MDPVELSTRGAAISTALQALGMSEREAFVVGILTAVLEAGAILGLSEDGSEIVSVPIVPDAPATPASIITGTSVDEIINPDNLADVTRPAAATGTSGTVTLSFADTLYRTTTISGNITDITLTAPPVFAPAIWAVKATTSYSIALPNTSAVGSPEVFAESITVPANSTLFILLINDGTTTHFLPGWASRPNA